MVAGIQRSLDPDDHQALEPAARLLFREWNSQCHADGFRGFEIDHPAHPLVDRRELISFHSLAWLRRRTGRQHVGIGLPQAVTMAFSSR